MKCTSSKDKGSLPGIKTLYRISQPSCDVIGMNDECL
jgi:hypothetical protein